MPIDPSISLGAQGVGPLINPLQMMQQVEQGRALRDERQAIAGQRTAQTAKLQRDADREAAGQAAVDDFFASYQPGQPLSTAQVGNLYRTLGPEKGSAIVKGVMDFSSADLTNQDGVRKSMITRIAGVKALPEANREAAYNGIIKDYVQRGLFKPEEVAPYSPEQLDTYERMLLSPDKQYEINHPKPMDIGGRLIAPQADGTVKVLVDKAPEHSPAFKELQDVNADRVARGLKPKNLEQYQTEDANRRRSVTNISAGGSTPPGDFNKTGDDFLKSIPIQWRTTVKKISNYDEDPSKVASMRGGSREMVMQWVNQVNPGYDSSQFGNRAPTRKAFTTGTQGQQINAINTAIGHIDQITAVASELGNGNFVPGNKAWNAVQSMFGSDKVSNFDTLKDALAGEVASVLSKNGATVSGIAEAKEKISAANSPKQLAGYVKTLIPVMGSKLAALDYQYHQAMGEGDSFSALSPETKSILGKHGFDPSHPTVPAGNTQEAAAGFSVTAPNRKVYTFKSKEALEGFKRRAGIS